MKRDVQVAHSHSSQEEGKQVADAMPNNKTGTPKSCRHAFLFPFVRERANVLKRSKVLRNRSTKLKRIMILNFHFVPILDYVTRNSKVYMSWGIFSYSALTSSTWKS